MENILKILKKIINHYIVKNVLILMLASFFILYGTLVALRHYTNHGESIPVPDVRGLLLSEAANVLQAQNMRWHMSDSVYANSYRPGEVVNQNPEPNSRVKRNRNIFLIINALAPERVSMPNVVGISTRQAKSILEQHGLIIERFTPIPHMYENLVLRQLYRGQEISRGTEIIKGSEIELVIGRGLSSERILVPNVIGNTYIEARDNLTKYFLNFGVIDYDNTVVTSADSVRAFIYQQRPAVSPNAMLQLGSSVDVWLTVDESKNPNIVQQSENE